MQTDKLGPIGWPPAATATRPRPHHGSTELAEARGMQVPAQPQLESRPRAGNTERVSGADAG